MILSDMPQTKRGSWFLHYREKMDADLIAAIEATVYEIWRIKSRIRALNTSIPGSRLPEKPLATPRPLTQSDALRRGLLQGIFQY